MFRKHSARARESSLKELEHARDLRAVITAALDATPVDDESLRRSVWTYVRAERDAGSSPPSVVALLTQLVDASTIGLPSVRQSVKRWMIRSCVQAYFGYHADEVVGGDLAASVDPITTPPVLVSSRDDTPRSRVRGPLVLLARTRRAS
jgi:hypothetical protein